MSDSTYDPAVAASFPQARSVEWTAAGRWLAAGWRDLRRAGPASLFYGMCFAVAGWVLQSAFVHAYALFAGLTTGFLLLAPFLAMGIYDLSRRMERGEPPQLMPTLAAWRPNLANVSVLAGVLAVVLLLWARASMVLFALFFDAPGLPTFAGIVRSVVTLDQPEFALIYFAVGGCFALFVFAVSVVAVPLMLDRKTDAVTAAIASLAVCARNPGAMLVWAGCIALLAAAGIAAWFAGLVVVMPWLGHATWHAYRDLVADAPRGADAAGARG
ncbi:MAG TPA: DUF2189 domain-containing protein [Rhodocyclaceae bacterium]